MSTEDADTYSEDRRRHRHRKRVWGYALSISLWALSVVPLARELTEGHRGAYVVFFYVAAAAINLGAAAVIHGIYARLTNSRFWSPWVFLIAALLSIAGYLVESSGVEPPPNAAATEAATNDGWATSYAAATSGSSSSGTKTPPPSARPARRSGNLEEVDVAKQARGAAKFVREERASGKSAVRDRGGTIIPVTAARMRSIRYLDKPLWQRAAV